MHLDKGTINQWQDWNLQGFIPGPEESEEAFQERVVFCQNLENNLEKTLGAHLPFEVNDQQSREILEEVLPRTNELYGIQPRWVPLFFNNYQLAPWHGGCAWIFQLNDQTPTAAFLQLRNHFRHSPSFLGIYQRSELIAHELAHVGRMLYQEPQFEEFFAYQSSSSRLRRWLGPIVQSSKESLFFILLLGLVVMTDLALLSLGTKMDALSWGVRLLPLLFLALALGRLIYRHQTLQRCLKNLETLYTFSQAKHILYRLRDNEIKEFSKFSPLETQEFIDQATDGSFRWRFLKTLYPFSSKVSSSYLSAQEPQ